MWKSSKREKEIVALPRKHSILNMYHRNAWIQMQTSRVWIEEQFCRYTIITNLRQLKLKPGGSINQMSDICYTITVWQTPLVIDSKPRWHQEINFHVTSVDLTREKQKLDHPTQISKISITWNLYAHTQNINKLSEKATWTPWRARQLKPY